MTPTAGALLACVALIACGGGDWESVRVEKDPFGLGAEAPTSVGVEGCLVDRRDRPLAQPLQARGSDGRLVASASSDADGRFRLQVPAGEVLRIEAASAPDDGVTIMVGRHAVTLGGCLRA
ncbi:MAG: hypothetical protein QM722_12130 [Piscinibacter sp.]